jgi:glycosyltransferase involved in cell wall biosynthesis
VAKYTRSLLIHFLKYNRYFRYKDHVDADAETVNFFTGETLELMFPESRGFGRIKSIVIQLDSCAQISFYSLEALADLFDTQIILERKRHSFEACKSERDQLDLYTKDGVLHVNYSRHKNLYVNISVLLAIIGFNWSETINLGNNDTHESFKARNLQSCLELASSWTEQYKTLNTIQSETLSSALVHFRNFEINKSRMAIQSYSNVKEKTAITRILVVAHEHKMSGAPLIACDIAKHFASIGMVVKVVVIEGDAQGGIFANEGIEVETLSQRQEKRGVYAPTNTDWILTPQAREALLEIINEFSPDVSILNSLASADTQESFSSSLVPIILYTHENWAQRAQVLGSQRPFLGVAKRAMDRSNLLLFASENCLDSWGKEVFNECLLAVATIQNSEIDPELNRDRLREDCRAKLGIPLDAKVVLAVGVFEPRKRITDIILGFLKFDEKDSYLILLGQAGYFIEYESQIFRLAKQSNRIIVHSLVRDINSFYASADIFIHASEEEVFPLVLQEAASWRIPIICSNYGGVNELLGRRHPYIFPIGDTDSIVEQLKNVYSHLEFAGSLSGEIHSKMNNRLRSYRDSLEQAVAETRKSQIYLRTEGT